MQIASRASLALLAFFFGVAAFAAEPSASTTATINCDKITENENMVHVSRLRLILSSEGTSEIALMEGEIHRGEDDEAIDHVEKIYVPAAKCEAVKGQPLQFTCSVTDIKSLVASVTGEGKEENGNKTFTVTRVDRDSKIKQMKFSAGECTAK